MPLQDAPAPTAAALDPAFFEHLLDTIIEAIPAPAADCDSARAILRNAARLALQAVGPSDAFAAVLAAQVIAGHYAVMDALRRAAAADLAPAMATRLRNNAAALARNMRATLTALRQHQSRPPAEVPLPQSPQPVANAATRAAPQTAAPQAAAPAPAALAARLPTGRQ